MSEMSYEEHNDTKWSQRLERLAPVLSFSEVEERRKHYALQATTIASLALIALPFFVFHPALGYLAIAALFAGSISLTLLVMDEPLYDNKRIKENLRQAAERAFNSGGEIDIARYVRRGTYYRFCDTVDEKFIQTLTPRQMRWIKRAYKAEEKKVLAERTQQANSLQSKLDANMSALDGLVNKDSMKNAQYKLKAMKELEAEYDENRKLTEAEQMEQDFNALNQK